MAAFFLWYGLCVGRISSLFYKMCIINIIHFLIYAQQTADGPDILVHKINLCVTFFQQ